MNNVKLEEKLPLYLSSFTYRFIKLFIQFTFIKGKLYEYRQKKLKYTGYAPQIIFVHCNLSCIILYVNSNQIIFLSKKKS